MRIRFKPTAERRAALKAQLDRLRRPGEALALLRPSIPADFTPASAVCSVERVHPDRFVLRVEMRSAAREELGFALKAYSDDFGASVWAHAHALAQHGLGRHDDGPCLPGRYIPDERLLVFPWVNGHFLSEIVDERKPDLLRRAAELAARLHSAPIVPEAPTTAAMMVEEARGRCDRLRERWPETTALVEPLLTMLEEATAVLDPFQPGPVHGDMAAGQFLWTGAHLVLLDFDMFGYMDPAYDAGHFLAQLERRCLLDATLPADSERWLDCFRDAYLAAMPGVSPRNVSFYHGLTLVRKIYTVCRRQPIEGLRLAPLLAAQARAALTQAAPSGAL